MNVTLELQIDIVRFAGGEKKTDKAIKKIHSRLKNIFYLLCIGFFQSDENGKKLMKSET